ncbi:hypothetical protein [Allopontixanthobacter sp.]|uniref:hypothetical protein n=1 Tax=Allopontixanthobacter sp. TaxID=2906452 RepID=UPI002ABB4BDC|nr:hypothetical protein [Allopontixanthobacter sp.]MDZ4306803.1 hypothetical protein [Allopontixanthobacter sp.]
MKIRNLFLAAAAVSLAAAPAVSAADTARASAPVTSESELGGSNGILGLLAVGILAAFIALTAIDSDDDEPISA